MDKDAVLAFAKKNVISLICAVVALGALGAIFYPLGGMQDALQQQSDEKAKLFDTLNGFFKERKRPVNSLDSVDYGKLDAVPNKNTIDLGTTANQVWAEYKKSTVAGLVELNRSAHPLMQSDELPTFIRDPSAFKFPKLYLAVLSTDPTVSGIVPKDVPPVTSSAPSAAAPTAPAAAAPASAVPGASPAPVPVAQSPESKLLIENNDLNLQNDVLHGGKPPSPADEIAAEKELWTRKYEVRIVEQNGKRVNEPDLLVEYNAEVKDLPLDLKRKTANTFKCYVEPTAFYPDNAIVTDPTKAPASDEVWYCQNQIWIDRDLCQAIAQINANSSSVMSSPVKRVLSLNNVDFTSIYVKKPVPSGAPGQPVPPPMAPGGAGADSAPIVPDYTVSPTGRYCNPMYDVVKFNLCVDIDASRVNEFIETLSRNNFMTVTSESEFVVDTQAEFARGFMYGSAPVVRLQLSGESLFFRAFTTPAVPDEKHPDLMPDKIKILLGIISGTPGGPGGVPGMPGMPGQNPGGMRGGGR